MGVMVIRASIWRCNPTLYPIPTVSDAFCRSICTRAEQRPDKAAPPSCSMAAAFTTTPTARRRSRLGIGPDYGTIGGVVGNLTGASNITTTQGIKTGIGAVPILTPTHRFQHSRLHDAEFHREGHDNNQSRRLLRRNESECRRQCHAQCGDLLLRRWRPYCEWPALR